MRFATVCSGIGAPEFALTQLGWDCAFGSEIEPYARAVYQHHYPTTTLHGDFTSLEIRDNAAVDVLIAGTPCQDFSIAGLRAGIAGDKGHLTLAFLEFVSRLTPRWVVWENVPGVMCADNGLAFGTFLGRLGELGYGFAYRILDAQFFGVPQRRRRVFVVAHSSGSWQRSAAVLFEPNSLSWDSAPSRQAEERTIPPLEARADAGGAGWGTDFLCGGGVVIAFECQGTGEGAAVNFAPPLRARDCPSKPGGSLSIATENFVRRLTPTECERLMGFPDEYTLIPFNGKPASDGRRYRALGNSMVTNVVRWIGERIELVERLDREAAYSLPLDVRLTPAECDVALAVSKARESRRQASCSIHKWNRDPRDHNLQVTVESVGAEMAVARSLGYEWHDSPIPDWDGDGGMLGVQVRHTRYSTGHLLLHPEDKDSHWFFLVVGAMPNFSIRGAISGYDGKRIGKWTELVPNRPAFCVEQSQLTKRLIRTGTPAQQFTCRELP